MYGSLHNGARGVNLHLKSLLRSGRLLSVANQSSFENCRALNLTYDKLRVKLSPPIQDSTMHVIERL